MLRRHGFLHQRRVLIFLNRFQPAIEIRNDAVGEFTRAGEVAAPLGDLGVLPRFVEFFLQALHVLDGFLFLVPFGG